MTQDEFDKYFYLIGNGLPIWEVIDIIDPGDIVTNETGSKICYDGRYYQKQERSVFIEEYDGDIEYIEYIHQVSHGFAGEGFFGYIIFPVEDTFYHLYFAFCREFEDN
jgi:hypothetical protein